MFVMKLEDIYGYGQREVDTFIASSGLEGQGGMWGPSTSTSSPEWFQFRLPPTYQMVVVLRSLCYEVMSSCCCNSGSLYKPEQ